MSFPRWFPPNWADTDEPARPAPGPLDLPVPPDEALRRVEAAARSLPNWRVESVDPAAGTLRATRRTRLLRFVDDITVRVEPVASGSRIHARSRSRVGLYDFGQNRRNLLELFAFLQ